MIILSMANDYSPQHCPLPKKCIFAVKKTLSYGKLERPFQIKWIQALYEETALLLRYYICPRNPLSAHALAWRKRHGHNRWRLFNLCDGLFHHRENCDPRMKKTRILFVCHGNICRSPMAEFVMKQKVAERGLSAQFEIASAATSREEIGNPVYPPARRMLAAHGISCDGKTARQMTRADYNYYDYIIIMDQNNRRNIQRIVGQDVDNKISLLMDYTDHPRDVADPWYTGDFQATWDDVQEGCEGFLSAIGC